MNTKCSKSISNAKFKEDMIDTNFFIPYIGPPSVIFSKKLMALLKKYYYSDSISYFHIC